MENPMHMRIDFALHARVPSECPVKPVRAPETCAFRQGSSMPSSFAWRIAVGPQPVPGPEEHGLMFWDQSLYYLEPRNC